MLLLLSMFTEQLGQVYLRLLAFKFTAFSVSSNFIQKSTSPHTATLFVYFALLKSHNLSVHGSARGAILSGKAVLADVAVHLLERPFSWPPSRVSYT